MKLALILTALFILFATSSAEADMGSCYSMQPICIQGHPACVCTLTNVCFWACR